MEIARLPASDGREFLPAGRIRRMAAGSLPVVVAGILAERDANRRNGGAAPEPRRRGVVLGTGLGPLGITGELLELLGRLGPAGAEPFLFIESLHNAPAGHAAIVLECRGPTLTPVAGDASAAAAVIVGARMIQDGRADRVYAGGSEEISDFLLGLLARLLPPARPIPRLGEGAAVFRLEAEPSGGSYARIVGSGLGQDPGADDLDYGKDPDIPREVAESALREAGWRTGEVDLLVTAGSGPSRLAALERGLSESWENFGPAGRCRRLSPGRIFGALAGSGGFAVAAAALEIERGRARRALVCLPAWGGSCQALTLAAGD